MVEDIKFCGIDGVLKHRTSASAVYTLLGPDCGCGSPVIGSLDVHHPCDERAFFSATAVIDGNFKFDLSPADLAQLLPGALGIEEPELWDIRIWKITEGACDDNDSRTFRR